MLKKCLKTLVNKTFQIKNTRIEFVIPTFPKKKKNL